VVGPNWAVNTVPSFATQVQQAVGGQLINGQPVTQSAAPAPVPSPTATVLRYSGTSNWNSPPFTITGNSMTVTYTYSGNQDSNFIADMVANDQGDHLSIANTIGTSGGTTTTLYPTESAGSQYHLEITATGSWTIKITM
jgi:hypothetical protein